jgi:membrane-associated phospholipid phosphatase
MNPASRWSRFRAAVGDSLGTPSRLPRAWRLAAWLAAALAVACALYPSNHELHYADPRGGEDHATVVAVEHVVRHVNTVVAVALPLLHRDLAGLAQLAVVTVVGMAATHIPKRVLNDWEVAGTRLGQRPQDLDSRHNVPSGHSSLASAAAWFVCRRYGWRWAWLLLPITAATMWARVMLDAHTVSAVLAGLFVGVAVVVFFVTPRARDAA